MKVFLILLLRHILVYLNTCKYGLNEIIDYVHGKADINNTIEKNNMVLGIDEYLPAACFRCGGQFIDTEKALSKNQRLENVWEFAEQHFSAEPFV